MPHLAVGVLAGVMTARLRLHIGVPGHKAILWMLPVLVARLRHRHWAGAMAGVSLAACTSLALGGNLGGQWLLVALVPVAGAILDAAVALAERRGLSHAMLIAVLMPAAMAANLVCAVKRLASPSGRPHILLGLSDPYATILSYAFIGLLCGLLAGLVNLGLGRALDRRPKHTEPT